MGQHRLCVRCVCACVRVCARAVSVCASLKSNACLDRTCVFEYRARTTRRLRVGAWMAQCDSSTTRGSSRGRSAKTTNSTVRAKKLTKKENTAVGRKEQFVLGGGGGGFHVLSSWRTFYHPFGFPFLITHCPPLPPFLPPFLLHHPFPSTLCCCCCCCADHKKPVRSLAFSPDGTLLYTACDDGYVKVFDTRAPKIVASLTGHASWVLSVDASCDGEHIVTG